LRAAGVSQWGLAKPAILLAVIGCSFSSPCRLFPPGLEPCLQDLQFEIRNQFVAAVLQEGTFTNISEKLTVYLRARDKNGELTGLVVQDERDRMKPVTIIAERGAFVGDESGSRVFMVNGNRQQLDRATGKLSVLSFEKYTLDLAELRDAPGARSREPQERYLHELWFDEETLADRHFGRGLVSRRIAGCCSLHAPSPSRRCRSSSSFRASSTGAARRGGCSSPSSRLPLRGRRARRPEPRRPQPRRHPGDVSQRASCRCSRCSGSCSTTSARPAGRAIPAARAMSRPVPRP